MPNFANMDILKKPDFDNEAVEKQPDTKDSSVLHGLSFENGFRCENVYRTVYDFYSDSKIQRNIGSFEISIDGSSFSEQSNPELLVSYDEFHDFLESPSEEYFDYDAGSNKFDFNLAGIKGTFDCNTSSFENLFSNGKQLSEEELIKVSLDSFFNMVPKGSLFRYDLESEMNHETLKEIRARDEVIADFKDKRFQSVLSEFSALASDMNNKIKSYSKEVFAYNEFRDSSKRETLWDNFKDSLYNRFFKDKDLDKMNPFVRIVGKGLKREKDFYNKNLDKHLEKVSDKGREIDFCHQKLLKKYKKLNELSNGLFEDLPFDRREKYLSKLREFSLGIKCINELEDYRKNIDLSSDNNGNIKNMKRYFDNISNDCRLLSSIVDKSKDIFKDVHKVSCQESYTSCMEYFKRLEDIKYSSHRIDIISQPEDVYKSIVKSLMEERPEQFGKNYLRENPEVIFKMKKLSYSDEQIAGALEKASPCFSGKDKSVCLKYVKSVVEKKNNNSIESYKEKSFGDKSRNENSYKKNNKKSKTRECNER